MIFQHTNLTITSFVVSSFSKSSRSNFLKEVNLILADLIEWSDQLLLEQTNNSNSKGTMNDRYKQLSQDLMKTVKVKARINSMKIEEERIKFRIRFSQPAKRTR